jgi:antitoxin VapB
LARRQGVSKTAAIHQALRERLHRLGRGSQLADRAQDRLQGELRAIRQRVGRLPVLDTRSDEQIIGYDEHGVPV